VEVIGSAWKCRRTREVLASVLLAALCFGTVSRTSLARAQAADATQAREAFERGVEASREQRWQAARLEFQHSRALVVKPSTLFNLAVCDLKLGLGREALDALDAFAQIANPGEHGAMLERAVALRAEAERLEDAERPAGDRGRALIEPAALEPADQTAFERGRDAYARGDDELALEAFERVHARSGRAELLYDIGVVCDRLRDDTRAIEAFRGFLAQLPQAPEAELVLREKSKPEPMAAAEPSSAPAQDTASARPNLRTPRALLGLAGGLAAASVGSALWWADRSAAADACEAPTPQCINLDQLHRQQSGAIALTLALDAAAVALGAIGGAWLVKRKRERRVLAGPGLRLKF
jgi:hypothetical protein